MPSSTGNENMGDVEELVASTDDDGLCSQCAALDLDEIYKKALGPFEDRLYHDKICSRTLSPSCRLCQLFAYRAPSTSPSPQIDKVPIRPRRLLLVRTVPGDWDLLGGGCIQKVSSSKVACMGVIVSDSEEEEEEILRIGQPCLFLHKSSDLSTDPFQALEQVDFGLLRNWLHSCKGHHDGRCNFADDFSGRPGTEIYLIDCKNLEMVQWDQQAPYVAMSYVWWGQARHRDDASTKSSMHEEEDVDHSTTLCQAKLPQLILDAISVVESLGFRYLWIDRYCVSQEDAVKHLQIQAMDMVYSQAEVTIVSLGQSPSEGLPGVSSKRSVPRVHVTGHCFAPALCRPDELILESAWNTRGWTYQEALLSRRKLYFTKEQTIFECCNGMCCEVDMEHTPIYPFHSLNSDLTIEFLWDHIRCYNVRQLSYESDALSAFLGILGRFAPAIQHYWGVPIQGLNVDKDHDPLLFNYEEKYFVSQFVQGLAFGLWSSPDSTVTRRPQFPSWSWTGWTNLGIWPLGYESGRSLLDKEVCIEIESKDGSVIQFVPFVLSGAIDLPHIEHSRFIWISARTISLRLPEQGANLRRDSLPSIIEHVTHTGEHLQMYLSGFTDGVVALGECTGILIGDKRWSHDSPQPGEYILLLVADRGTCYERIGSLSLWANSLERQPSEHVADKAAGRPVEAHYEDIPESSWVQRKLRIG